MNSFIFIKSICDLFNKVKVEEIDFFRFWKH